MQVNLGRGPNTQSPALQLALGKNINVLSIYES